MKPCAVIAPVSFGPGVRLRLTEAQAGARRLLLRPLADDCYEVLSLVQFKAGEIIGVDGEVPKSLQPLLSLPSGEAPAVAKPVAAPSGKHGKPPRETGR